MTLRAQRALLITIFVGLIAAAVALIASALSSDITFYKTPKEIAAAHPALVGTRLRIGGFVERGSVKKRGAQITFSVTDFSQQITISYRGILPDLFREGQGVIAEGVLVNQSLLRADKIFAKHDENYRPPNLPQQKPKKTL